MRAHDKMQYELQILRLVKMDKMSNQNNSVNNLVVGDTPAVSSSLVSPSEKISKPILHRRHSHMVPRSFICNNRINPTLHTSRGYTQDRQHAAVMG